MLIGCHVSIAGGIYNAVGNALNVDCETFQVFTQNQRQWKTTIYDKDTINRFKKERKDEGFAQVPLIAHASYLINMCATDKEKLNKSRRALTEELQRCDRLAIDFLVIHPGSHGGKGEQWGMNTIADTINTVLQSHQSKVQILLETTAGQGNTLGYQLEQLDGVMQKIEPNNQVGICADTCHMFAAGFDFRTEKACRQTIDLIKNTVGSDVLKVWHFNDSLHDIASKKDRHAPIGEGYIGEKGFRSLVNAAEFKNIPAILEVPGGEQQFAHDIALLKSMRE
ncbi:MAG: deoxyribonuclease IV [Caldithrix sp.]|nr:deoxyribonuclease IV [Caldithrix sp.]